MNFKNGKMHLKAEQTYLNGRKEYLNIEKNEF